MGSRGRNRRGYYVTLLYALDLQYEWERRLKGEDESLWHPSPRNRPDHFARWALDVLTTIGSNQPRTLDELTEELEQQHLSHVARMLRFSVVQHETVRSQAPRAAITKLPLTDLMAVLGFGAEPAERHPQARKFAQVVSRHLDVRWRQALERIVEEYGGGELVPSTAFLLGGLPPSYGVLNDMIFMRLADTDLASERDGLTVLQFYGLVTGTLPPAEQRWQEALDRLNGLTGDELEMLSTLTDRQVEQLRALPELGWHLAQLRGRTNLSVMGWRSLGAALRAHEAVEHANAVAVRVRGVLERLGERLTVMETASSPAWEAVGELDEEVLRWITRGELSYSLYAQLHAWDQAGWEDVRELLRHEGAWAVAYLEDRSLLEAMFRARTRARLNLRDLFPATIDWLDHWLQRHMEEALVQDVGELDTFAALVSRRVQESFWAVPKRSARQHDRDGAGTGLERDRRRPEPRIHAGRAYG